jgi:hypothetical protein
MNVFLVSVVTTVLLSLNAVKITELVDLDQPRRVVEYLALFLPSQALKFTNYIYFEGFGMFTIWKK